MATRRTYKELEQRLKATETAAARAEQAEERFYAASERLEYLLSSTSAVIYTARPEGEYPATFISNNVTDLVGYSPREFTEDPEFWCAHIHPEDQAFVLEEVKKLFECGAHTYEYRFLKKNGAFMWVRDQMKLIRDKAGKPIEIVGYWADVTEIKQTEERLRKLSCLQDRLLGTMSLDAKLKVVTDGVVEILGADFARLWMIGPGDLCERGCSHALVTEGPHLCRDRTRCLHLIASSGRYTHIDGGHRRVPLGCYKIGRVASGEEPGFITNDVTHDPRVHDHEWARSLGLVSFAGYRLISPKMDPIGVLALFSTQAITTDENALLGDLASSTSQLILTGMMGEALRESELRYRTLFESAHDAIFIMEGDRYIDCNQRTAQIFGCRREDLIGKKSFGASPEYQPGGALSKEIGAERLRAAYAGTPQFFEWLHQRPDGEFVDTEVSLNRIEVGGKSLLHAIVRDITERKRAEQALRDSELRYRTLFESAHEGIFIMQGGRVIDCNERMGHMFGCRPEDLIGKRPCELSPQYQAGGLLSVETGAGKIRAAYAGTPQFFEWQHRRFDGGIFFVEVSLNRFQAGGKPLLQAIVRDITERKHLEDALKLTQLSVDKAADAVQWIAPDGRFIYVNEEACRSLGYSREELLTMSVWDINPERTPEIFQKRWQMLKQQKAWLFETRHRTKDGRVFPVEVAGKYIASGDKEYYFAFVRDISERKQAEDELRESEEHFRLLSENIPVAVYSALPDECSSSVFVSGRFKELTGYEPQAFVDDPDLWSRVLHPDDQVRVWKEIEKHRTQKTVLDVEYRILTKNDEVKWIRDKANPVLDDAGDIARISGFMEDVTLRKQAEEALKNSEEQVRALNDEILNMLMVVSHDIRSPLVSIAATLKLLYKEVYGKLDESVKNTVNELLTRINRLSGIAEDFLGKAAVVKGTIDMEHRVLDLRADIIDPILEEFSPDIESQGITIDNRLGAIPADRIPIKANRIWMRTVFRNLFANALKYGGKGCRIAFGFEDHGSHYQLNVYNSGEPVSTDHRDKLFDKFYRIQTSSTTRVRGMGLGLYLVKEILNRQGGDIWYEAKEDGSNFVFTLPRE